MEAAALPPASEAEGSPELEASHVGWVIPSAIRAFLLAASILLSLVLAAPAHAYNGLPDDLTGYVWTGTVSTAYDFTNSYDDPSQLESREEGAVLYTDLVLVGEVDGEQRYSADVDGHEAQENTFICPSISGEPGMHSSRSTGVSGRHPLGGGPRAIGITSGPEGFALSLDPLSGPTTEIQRCTGGSETTTQYHGGHVGEYQSGSTGTAVLQQDRDPDPYHLVGITSWSLGNPPSPLFDSTTKYIFNATYDLRLVPAVTQFSWRMADRFDGRDDNADGLVDYFTPLPELAGRDVFQGGALVDQPVWSMEVTADAGCSDASQVQWVVDGGLAVEGGCKAVVDIPAYTYDGLPVGPDHTVTLLIDGVEQSTQTVHVKDWLIAAIGDSYGSGEGNPDVAKVAHAAGADEHSLWEDTQCHRSGSSAASQVAASVDAADDKSSVTLAHLSCSGAQIRPGVVTRYEGAAPDADKANKKDPQIEELADLLGQRKPDALLISIGGNDVGFADIIASCLVYKACHKGKKEHCLPASIWSVLKNPVIFAIAPSIEVRCEKAAHELFRTQIAKLAAEYRRLAVCLQPLPTTRPCEARSMGLDPARVLVTGYPDITRGADGKFCGKSGNDTILGDAIPQVLAQLDGRLPSPRVLAFKLAVRRAQRNGYLEIDGSEAEWAAKHVLKPLNKKLKQIAKDYGWTYVGSHVDAAQTHGYCAGEQRWVRTWQEAKRLQEAIGPGGIGQSPGAVHPNVEGQTAYRDAILPELKALGIPVLP